jgi:hypothetical protein
MILKVYLGGTNTGAGLGVSVAEGVDVDVSVSDDRGAEPGVGVAERVAVDVEVAGGSVGKLVKVSAGGPKGVGEEVVFGLGVTVGPMAFGGIDVPRPAQAVKSKKEKESSKNGRWSILIFSSIKALGWGGREKPAGKWL